MVQIIVKSCVKTAQLGGNGRVVFDNFGQYKLVVGQRIQPEPIDVEPEMGQGMGMVNAVFTNFGRLVDAGLIALEEFGCFLAWPWINKPILDYTGLFVLVKLAYFVFANTAGGDNLYHQVRRTLEPLWAKPI